jgi:methyl-accepting chemotaxis protein
MTIRRLMYISTALTLAMLLVLVLVVRSGFRQAIESSHQENSVALPSLVAMLETRFHVSQIQQYLSDVSATGEADGLKDAKAAYESALNDLDSIGSHSSELSAQIQVIKGNLTKFYGLGVEMATAYSTTGREAGNILMKRPGDGFDAQAEKLNAEMESLEKVVRTNMDTSANTAENQISSAQIISISLGLALCVLVVGSGVAVYRLLIRILGSEPNYASEIAHRIAAGDLSQEIRIPAAGRDNLLGSICDMQDGLRTLIRTIGETTDALAIAAHELSVAASQVSTAAAAQSDQSASMAASIEEMAVSITHISDSASHAHQSAIEANQLADSGSVTVSDAVREMASISGSVSSTTDSIRALGERSAEIAQIVDVIRDIADQTNLLALNAAIEAARAGEQGRGFAVVADEVRKLAERTANATVEIRRTVESVRDGTAAAVVEMDGGNAKVLAGVSLIEQAGSSMHQIKGGVQLVLTAADEIAAALKEQDTANKDIARNVEGIAQMTEETANIVMNVSDSAIRLEQLAQSMSASVHRFKI